MFSIFKKKITEKNWLRQTYLRNIKNKLTSPYANLFYYYLGITYNTKYGYNNGHFDLLHWAKNDNFLNDLTKDLRSVLPQHLYENYSTALEKFSALKEEPEYEEIEKTFAEYDAYAYNNAKEIENILKNYMLRNEN